VAASVDTFGSEAPVASVYRKQLRGHSGGDPAAVFRRLPEPKGPLAVFGYDYFTSHAKDAGISTPRLLSYQGEWGAGEEYAYEALNFADGTRTAQQIAADLTAEYGAIPSELVVEYLQTLKKIGVVQ